jgi:hypothetical protein
MPSTPICSAASTRLVMRASGDCLTGDHPLRLLILREETRFGGVWSCQTRVRVGRPTRNYIRQKPREFFASIGRKTMPDPSRAVSFTELLDEGVLHRCPCSLGSLAGSA